MSSLLSGLFKLAGRTIQQKAISFQPISPFPSLTSTLLPSISDPCSIGSVRTIVRNNFPKPKESKRIKVHGWRARLKTKGGRRVLMERILKGRWYYSH